MNNNFTEDELEALHMTAALAINGLASALDYTHTRNNILYPERLANDAYAIAEAAIIRGREYEPKP